MAFGVLAYPNISSEDYNVIQQFRKVNDELYYQLAEPHFSFVFPTQKLEEKEFIREVIEKSRGFKSFNFEIKCACVNKDSFLDYFHLLLVPDDGYSQIVKLHDKLYGDRLIDELRLDIDFIPHVGIANSKNPQIVKNWADQWNEMNFTIKGNIDMLTVINYDGSKLQDIMSIPLKEN